MSFVELPHYSDIDDCRKKARKVLNRDFTDGQINVIQNQIYSYINGKAHRHNNPFGPTDPETPSIALVEEDLVAAEIIKYYGDMSTLPIADQMNNGAEGRLTSILEDVQEDPDDLDESIEHTERKSWNMNIDKPIPRGNLRIV